MSTLDNAEREEARVKFLTRSGWGNADRISMGQDASTRSYQRLSFGGQKAVFMDAPPASEGKPCGADATPYDRIMAGWNGRARLAACRVDAFVGIANHLSGLGLSVPKVYAYDVDEGFAILEDLGDGVYAREIEKGANEGELYLAAVEALAHIHNSPAPEEVRAGKHVWPILEYDRLAMTTGAELFPLWYPKLDDGVSFPGGHARDFDDLCAEISEHVAGLPRVLMMRDYHAENLLWLPEREGLAKVGILDFQDAVRGPAAWDMTMFVHDARRDVSPEVAEAVVRRYLDLTGYQEADFLEDLALAGTINALRILGVFARLIYRDGKPRYRDFLEREWKHLEDCLHHPALADMKWIMAEAVPGRRGLKE